LNDEKRNKNNESINSINQRLNKLSPYIAYLNWIDDTVLTILHIRFKENFTQANTKFSELLSNRQVLVKVVEILFICNFTFSK